MNYGDLKKTMAASFKDMSAKFKHPRFSKRLSETSLRRDQTYARLALIAKALNEVGALASYANSIEEHDIVSPTKYWGRSIVLTPSFLTGRIYLLNGGDSVVVTEGANAGQNTFDRHLAFAARDKDAPFEKEFTVAPTDDELVFFNGQTYGWDAIGKATIEAMESILLRQDDAFQAFLGET